MKTHDNEPLTLRTLMEVMREIKPPRDFAKFWTASTAAYDRLTDETLRTQANNLGGREFGDLFGNVRIHHKPDQVSDCWSFADAITFARYMNGQLSELDLMNMEATGYPIRHCTNEHGSAQSALKKSPQNVPKR